MVVKLLGLFLRLNLSAYAYICKTIPNPHDKAGTSQKV